MDSRSKLLTAVFLSLAMLMPSVASAVTLSAYENAQSDPAKQSKLFHEAYSTALAKTVTGLRSSTFADGKEKTQQRLDKDRKLAILVNEVAVYATDDQSWGIWGQTGRSPILLLKNWGQSHLSPRSVNKLHAPAFREAVPAHW